MDDLIKRKDAERALTALGAQLQEKHHRTVAKCVCAVKDVPAVDAEPVRRGEWTEPYKNDIWDCYACSLCGHTCESKSRFCPECGAKMDGGTHNA